MTHRALSVLVTKEVADGEAWWVAQCLDYDIAAQGRDIADALYDLARMIVGRIVTAHQAGIDPFAGLGPAPAEDWQAFVSGMALTAPPVPAFAATLGVPQTVVPEILARVA